MAMRCMWTAFDSTMYNLSATTQGIRASRESESIFIACLKEKPRGDESIKYVCMYVCM